MSENKTSAGTDLALDLNGHIIPEYEDSFVLVKEASGRWAVDQPQYCDCGALCTSNRVGIGPASLIAGLARRAKGGRFRYPVLGGRALPVRVWDEKKQGSMGEMGATDDGVECDYCP